MKSPWYLKVEIINKDEKEGMLVRVIIHPLWKLWIRLLIILGIQK